MLILLMLEINMATDNKALPQDSNYQGAYIEAITGLHLLSGVHLHLQLHHGGILAADWLKALDSCMFTTHFGMLCLAKPAATNPMPL